MKIIILGAGRVGLSTAEILSREDNDVTLVDSDEEKLQGLQDRLDIRTIVGAAAHPGVLEQAGGPDADLVLAVTNHDEVNMAACQVAYSLFRTPKKIARIRSAEYLRHPEIFCDESIPIDVIISPEQVITQRILHLIKYPGALQVVDFAGGKIQLVALKAYYGGPLVGRQLRSIREDLPNVKSRVAAIYRQNQPIIPKGDTVIEPDDEVFFVAGAPDIPIVMGELRSVEKPGRRIMLAGAGNIGGQLARRLEQDHYHVKLIEHGSIRARQAAEQLENTVVLHGDAADEELMLQENIDSMDVFCALTNDDEANILSAMLAKRLGAHRTMALINRSAYVELIESLLDIAISPSQETVGSLLTHVRRGDMVAVHSLRRGAAEAIETIAHGDAASSRVVGRRIDEISLPSGTTFGALMRKDEVIIPHHDTVIEPEDHVILFVIDKRHIHDVERLFQVKVTFV
ncbi:MAG: Trk system potassium transporter TrkA [Proteobacteria bacterium]|jgi:trk system potassium uptake protein TrkA|nr:Trk system potassium transporter TrkA [Pseudomonadota bacterium]MBP09750.1 Trk system potassium transporter TrkA [Acidiferrobacteraceae bacterium]MDP6134830.1 Trk system potassium transporter TrkA [Arenicellales bacterium]MDP7221252.1 Trk system potassium transporter TrkA [Arenicellales bacterium]HJP09831.1 Trk system potassium transporter TrkA [Arenicellales bacterium]|tara:strand:- start:565 stop:1938 length:1374 start_codon:yes stop_codon:yes gene_type:complete